MKLFALILSLFLAVPAMAAEPVAGVPAQAGKADTIAAKIDMKKLRADIAQLSEQQKRELMGYIRKQLPRATEEERDAKELASRQRWQQMKPEERAEYRTKYAASWAKMTAEEKQIQREKIAERLRALPSTDREAIMQAVK